MGFLIQLIVKNAMTEIEEMETVATLIAGRKSVEMARFRRGKSAMMATISTETCVPQTVDMYVEMEVKMVKSNATMGISLTLITAQTNAFKQLVGMESYGKATRNVMMGILTAKMTAPQAAPLPDAGTA